MESFHRWCQLKLWKKTVDKTSSKRFKRFHEGFQEEKVGISKIFLQHNSYRLYFFEMFVQDVCSRCLFKTFVQDVCSRHLFKTSLQDVCSICLKTFVQGVCSRHLFNQFVQYVCSMCLFKTFTHLGCLSKESWLRFCWRHLEKKSWTNILDKRLGQTSWTNVLDKRLGQTSWTNILDKPLGHKRCRAKGETLTFICKSFWIYSFRKWTNWVHYTH